MKSNSLTSMLIATTLVILANNISSQTSPCDIAQILHNPDPPVLWSPDSAEFLVNIQDTAGVFQIYKGNTLDTTLVCISLNYPWSFLRPWSQRNKLQVQWHASGDYIICGVEKEFYNELLFVPYSIRLGWLQSGLWMDIWALTPDGNNWYNLIDTEAGFTGPAFTPDGTQCAWAEALDSSNLFVDIFGVWKLQLADFMDSNGIPSFANTTNINPSGSRWIEPGNFAPDGHSRLISSDIGLYNAEGQDQFILDIISGQVTNLTNSPMVWDEHGIFSPDGHKILFMSSYPYRSDTNSYHTFSIKTEFMLMNADGSGLQQLTHFRDTGYVESSPGIAATGFWSPDGSTIYAQSLIFPDYDNWIIEFYGNCGNDAVSVNEPKPSNFHIYPNPTQNTLYIESTLALLEAQITIINAFGQPVKNISGINGNTIIIQTEDLKSGVYFLQLQSNKYHRATAIIKHE